MIKVLNKYFDINDYETYVEFLLDDGRYILYEFDNNHKIKEKDVWDLNNIKIIH